MFIVVLAGCAIAAMIFRNSRVRRTEATSRLRPVREKEFLRFEHNEDSKPSPAGSMAARREDIEHLLRGKEDLPGE